MVNNSRRLDVKNKINRSTVQNKILTDAFQTRDCLTAKLAELFYLKFD